MSVEGSTGGSGAGSGCRLYGLDVLSDVDLFAARQPVTAGADVVVELGERVAATGEAPEGDLSVQWTTDSGLTARFVRRTDSSHLLRFEDTCDVVLDHGLGRVTVHMVEGVALDMGGVLVSGTVLSYLLMLRGEVVLHASAVDMGGRAIGFVGSSGMGKSTMATLMCRDGGLLVTDDVLRLSALDDTRYGCALGATELRLRSAAAGLTDDFGAEASHRATADDRRALSVAPATREDVPLAALLIPRPNRETSELSLTRLDPAAAALTLLSFPRILGIRDQQLLASQFLQVSEVAERVPVFVADVPWGPPFASDLASRLLAALDAELGASEGGLQEVRTAMQSPDAARIDQVLTECAEIPLDTDDPELAAIAVAIHLEESLELTVPADALAPEHLAPAAVLERTVRDRLVGR